MTLRVTFEMVPFGEEINKYHLATMDISNKGKVTQKPSHLFPKELNLENYSVVYNKPNSTKKDGPEGAILGFDVEHARDEGFEKLVLLALAGVCGRLGTILERLPDRQ